MAQRTSGTIDLGDDDSPGMRRTEKSLHKLVKTTQQPLLIIKTIFPFTPFPHQIVIDPLKVTIFYGMFFFTHREKGMLMTDIQNVTLITNLFFGSLMFELREHSRNPEPISYLPKGAAKRAEELILGLITARDNLIDPTQVSSTELRDRAAEIGKTNENRV